MSDHPDPRDGAGRRQPDQPDPEARAAGPRSERDAAVARVLAGADEQTRRNLEPMLARSSVLETIASVHGADEPLMVEDRPAKPDFLDTEEYAVARKAIGATGDPASARAGASSAEPGSEPAASDAGRDAARPDPGASARRSPARRIGLIVVLAAIAIAVVLLWLRSQPGGAVGPGATTANPSAASPTGTERPQALSASALAAPSNPAAPAATDAPTASGPQPTARPPATPAPSRPAPPPSASAPAPAPTASSDLLFPPKD